MKLISSKEITKNRLFTVTRDHAVDPDGFEIERAIVHHRGSAVMMPVDEKRRILLVRQYRLRGRSTSARNHFKLLAGNWLKRLDIAPRSGLSSRSFIPAQGF